MKRQFDAFVEFTKNENMGVDNYQYQELKSAEPDTRV